jgi:hypothetical protein
MIRVATIDEVADLLSVNEADLRRAIRAGELPALGDDRVDLREAISWLVRTARRRLRVEKAVL